MKLAASNVDLWGDGLAVGFGVTVPFVVGAVGVDGVSVALAVVGVTLGEVGVVVLPVVGVKVV